MKWFQRKPAAETPAERTAFVTAQENSDQPWAMFEIIGFENDGRIKVSFNWNKSFIQRLDELGFTSETEEDTVQLFFYASQMKPSSIEGMDGDPPVQTADLPNLSGNVNRIAR
jgi:hypothetical protein